MSQLEKEKPITEKDFDFFPIPDSKGMSSVEYKWTIKERVASLIKDEKLEPSDIMIRYNQKDLKSPPKIMVLSTGWYKIGKSHGWKGSKTELTFADHKAGVYIFKAQIWQDGNDRPFEASGMCDHNEGGKSSWQNYALMGTAETRAVVRAIRMMCPISGVKSEEDLDNIENSAVTKVFTQAEADVKQTQEKLENKKKPNIAIDMPTPAAPAPAPTTQIIKQNPNPAPTPAPPAMPAPLAAPEVNNKKKLTMKVDVAPPVVDDKAAEEILKTYSDDFPPENPEDV